MGLTRRTGETGETGVITARSLNRSTLARQLLLGREPVGVTDALRQVVALQAQQPASPYIALWNRSPASPRAPRCCRVRS